jgi:hypothetical protein
VLLGLTAATDLGYTPIGEYAATVPDEVEWLVLAARIGGGTIPSSGLDDAFFRGMFDYAREDSYLATYPR